MEMDTREALDQLSERVDSMADDVSAHDQNIGTLSESMAQLFAIVRELAHEVRQLTHDVSELTQQVQAEARATTELRVSVTAHDQQWAETRAGIHDLLLDTLAHRDRLDRNDQAHTEFMQGIAAMREVMDANEQKHHREMEELRQLIGSVARLIDQWIRHDRGNGHPAR